MTILYWFQSRKRLIAYLYAMRQNVLVERMYRKAFEAAYEEADNEIARLTNLLEKVHPRDKWGRFVKVEK